MRSVLLRRYRIVLGFFIAGLVLSGVTAFPLSHELDLLARLLSVDHLTPQTSPHDLGRWVLTVRDGLREMYAHHPWIAYGTDWLAFAHLVLAVFFIGPWRDPVRNVWVLHAGIIACALVLPLALICGPLRGIPFYWRLIDCSFGVLGVLPLLYCLALTRRMELTLTSASASPSASA
jgi:hypothetical protein